MTHLNGSTPRGYDDIKALAKEAGANIPDLLALARTNDPFFCGSPAQVAQAQWFADVWERFNLTSGVHLRRIHYRLVSQDPPARMHSGEAYENTDKCWSYICAAGKYARHLGMIDADLFVDKRNPDPALHVEYGWREARRAQVSWLDYTLPEIDADLVDSLSIGVPGVYGVTGYEYDVSCQPYHVEIWIEKSTMDDVLLPICERYGVNLVGAIGFQSITGVVNLLERVRASGKPARILYISDFDPGGDGMPVSVSRHLEYWIDDYAPGADIAVETLALTAEQVRAYDLPPTPIKASDKRADSFLERHGVKGATELDALEALRPGELARIVTEAIVPYRDPDLAQKYRWTKARAMEQASEAWEELIEDYSGALEYLESQAAEIASKYQDELARLSAQLSAELAPIAEHVDSVWQDIQNLAADFRPALPDLPQAQTDGQDTDDWLFYSARSYGEQLAMYRARKGQK